MMGMATEKKNGTLAAGATEDLTITNLAKFGVIWRDSPLSIAMIQPSSGDPVPVEDSGASHGAYVGEMVGVTLRLVNKGTATANVSVYEE
jgi:hypothetical protein